jgi:diguanylate cyclase (GGDEF)-like protein/PAS domain S-box-containing protein
VSTLTTPADTAGVPEAGAILAGVTAHLAGPGHSRSEIAEVVTRTAGILLSSSAVLWAFDPDTGAAAVLATWAPSPDERDAIASAQGAPAHAALRDAVAQVATTLRPAVGDVGTTPTLALAAVPVPGGPLGPAVLSVHRPAASGPYLARDLVLLQQLADSPAGPAAPASGREGALTAAGAASGIEAMLAATRSLLHTVAEAAPVVLFASDAKGRLVLVEGGLADDDALPLRTGRSVFETFAEHPALCEKIRGVLAGGVLTRVRLPLPGRDLEAWLVPLSGPSEKIEGIAGIAVDVSERVAAEAIASESTRRLAALVESATDIIAVLTPHGIVRYANPAVEKVLGQQWKTGQVVDVFRLMHPDDRQRLRQHTMEALRRRGVTDPIEFRMIHADGTWRSVEAVGNWLLDDPAIGGFVVTIRDVTARRVAEQRSELNAARQAEIARLGNWALRDLDLAGLLDDAMGALTAHLGAECVHVLEIMPGSDLLVLRASRGHAGAPDGIVLVPTDATASPASLALSTAEPVVSEDLRADGRFDVPALWSDSGCASVLEVPIPGPNEPAGVLGVCHRSPRGYDADDVHFTQAVANVLGAAVARHAAEVHIREQATRDQLTGLPNRVALAEHLDGLLADSPDSPLAGGLLVLDIDRFKEINDTLGHQVGDTVLVEVANRFRRMRDQVDMVARLGGDEFGIYSSVLRTASDGEQMARRLLDILGRPIEIGGARLRLRGSVGVAEAAPPSGARVTDAVSLLRRAEGAMYRAKQFGTGCSRWTPDLDRANVSKLSLAGELGEAIESKEFVLAYQPKVAGRTRRPLGVEALVRWRHPVRGTVPPDSFVPLAEQTGMIKPLTAWVLAEALGQRSRWGERYSKLAMAVNLSASTLADPELFDAVASAVEKSGAPPESIELEITESAVMHDPDRALAAMTELAQIGVRFAIDDFGTGYSSLAYLQRLPVTLVKVDKSFITPLIEPGPARSIVRAVIELAHSLDIHVAAEGVESAEVASMLIDLGCDELQGYHIGRPMAPDSLETWLDVRLGD